MKPKTIIKLVYLVCCFVYGMWIKDKDTVLALTQIRELKDE